MTNTFRKALIGTAVAAATLLAGGVGSASATTGTKGGPASRLVNLTSEQQSCLDSALAGISSSSTKAERKASVRAATKACGIWKQYAKLSTQSQSCVEANGLTNSNGLPTKAQKRTFKSLASKCGFQIRTKG